MNITIERTPTLTFSAWRADLLNPGILVKYFTSKHIAILSFHKHPIGTRF